MTSAIELQVISKILTSNNQAEVDELLSISPSYYSIYRPHIQFIIDFNEKYGKVPDTFSFLARFQDVELVEVHESMSYITDEMNRNRQRSLLIDMFNTIKDFSGSDPLEAWKYIEAQCEKVQALDTHIPLDIIHDVDKRAEEIVAFSRQQRIPTGFKQIDDIMYGGLSTVEELCLFFGRTNTGKSWIASRLMETAQKNGFPVLYYSPEMQGSFLGTRFDTWRGNFQNSMLHQGVYSEQYLDYTAKLKQEETGAYIVEDKDAPDGEVTVSFLRALVKKLKIKELIIDGLSYMTDESGKRGDSDYIKYKNLCADLFRLSKQFGCAVVVMMQANRASKDSKDDKGEVFPNIYNIEGSDHPARIATSAFALRQIFEKHILDIRCEKGRSMMNNKLVFSYMWDINNGKMQYVEDPESAPVSTVTPIVNAGVSGAAPVFNSDATGQSSSSDDDIFPDDNIEF